MMCSMMQHTDYDECWTVFCMVWNMMNDGVLWILLAAINAGDCDDEWCRV